MTQHEFGASGSKISATWYRERQRARETAYSAEEFSPIERERYDLDTAGINGEENPDRLTYDPYGPPDEVDRRDSDLMD